MRRTLNGRYELQQRAGIGGMSEVWRARDRVLDRPVAVKLLAPGHAEEPGSLERIRTEARAAAKLLHPNVASVHDFGEAELLPGESLPYLVMELVEGRPWPRIWRPARSTGGSGSGSAPRCVPRWPPRTRTASCTGTSSPPTSCSPRPG
ncbi:hypothetical protein [Micromonospora zhanjiangensis]